MKALLQLIYLGWWFIRARLFGRRKPLQSVVFVTNGCNSTCRHCTTCTEPNEPVFMPYAEIERQLDYCYAQGARMLDIEGVRLLQWRDDNHTVNEIFCLARQKGFYSTSTMIAAADYNAWKNTKAEVDVLWVSIKGVDDCALLEHLQDASIYMVVDAQNYRELTDVLDFVQQHPAIQQIAFNFHTPFKGTAQLALSKEQRKEVIEQLIAYKRKGYRIMNSVSGLKNMLTLQFQRHCWICNFIYCDGRRSPQCIDNLNSGICQHCGFSMAGEMNAVFNMKPDTILAGVKLRNNA